MLYMFAGNEYVAISQNILMIVTDTMSVRGYTENIFEAPNIHNSLWDIYIYIILGSWN